MEKLAAAMAVAIVAGCLHQPPLLFSISSLLSLPRIRPLPPPPQTNPSQSQTTPTDHHTSTITHRPPPPFTSNSTSNHRHGRTPKSCHKNKPVQTKNSQNKPQLPHQIFFCRNTILGFLSPHSSPIHCNQNRKSIKFPSFKEFLLTTLLGS